MILFPVSVLVFVGVLCLVAVKRGLGLLGLFTAALIGGTASAVPIIIRDTIAVPFFETRVPHDCRPGVTRTVVATEVFSFHTVETARAFHIEGTDTGTCRIDWSDGSYTLIEFAQSLGPS